MGALKVMSRAGPVSFRAGLTCLRREAYPSARSGSGWFPGWHSERYDYRRARLHWRHKLPERPILLSRMYVPIVPSTAPTH
jgi:hypothetical protein